MARSKDFLRGASPRTCHIIIPEAFEAASSVFNLMVGTPEGYDMTNATSPVCTSIDAGPGIGIETGKVNSSLCTPSTVSNSDYNRFMFADLVYVTPQVQRKLGEHAFDKIRNRW